MYVNFIAVRKYIFVDSFLFSFVYKIFAVTILNITPKFADNSSLNFSTTHIWLFIYCEEYVHSPIFIHSLQCDSFHIFQFKHYTATKRTHT